MAAAIAQDEQLDVSMYPIASLLDDLKNEDLQLRLNATHRIKIIAQALGPERTRGELLPFITDTIDDEDDVLLALAEELGNFVEQVGGAAYAAVLLQPLETLSTVEESMVREKAVHALCNLSTHVATVANDEARTLHVDHLLPLLHRLASGDWFTSRISACSLISHVYQNLPDRRPELRDDVLSMFKRLASDDTPMVRRAVASNISSVGGALLAHAPEKIGKDLLPIFASLVEDEQDSVRLLIVENAALFANLLSQASMSNSSDSNQPNTTTTTKTTTTITTSNTQPPPTSSNDEIGSDAIMTTSSQTTGDNAVQQTSTSAPVQPDNSSSAEMHDLPSATNKDDMMDGGAESPGAQGNAITTATTTSEPPVASTVGEQIATTDVNSTNAAPTSGTEPNTSADVDSTTVVQAANGPSHDSANGNGTSNSISINGVDGIVSMIRGFSEDKSWRVRYMVADQLAELCEALGPAATRSDLLPAYISVLKDSEPEVRTAAAFKVTDVIKKIIALPSQAGLSSGLDYVISEIIPIVEQLVTDSAQHVRSALASNIMGLAPILGSEMTSRHLVDVVLALLKDDCPEVRLNVIARLDKVSFIMSIEKLSGELLPAIVDLAEDKNWRVRLAIIERIALLASQLGKQFFEDNVKLGELCISWLGDSVFSIREAAITNLKKLTEIFGVDWAKRHIVPQVLDMYDKSSNYLLRMTALHAIGVLSQVVAVETVEDMFLPIVTERASRDPVPNVRFCSAKTLNLVIPFVRQDARESKIKPCLLSLTDANEKDADVNYFAQQALTKLAQSPCPT